MNFWQLTFHFPDGGIYSNLVASILWTTPSFIIGFIVGHRKLVRHLNHHHEALKAHISAEHEKSRKHLEQHIGVK